MPRLIKYNTSGIVDDVPDMALAVIEHTALFYGYEVLIDQMKRADPESKRKSNNY